ncbi:spermine oxidase-like isoform X2 [Hydractinia symbiolongicarpus]|nr:spermine oxidase-like isoform X2 [Hydractinia symbiolongicarpus]
MLDCFHKDVLNSCSLEDRLQAVNISNDLTEEVMEKQRKFGKKEFKVHKTVGAWVDKNYNAKLEECRENAGLCVALKSAFMFKNMNECYYNGCVSLHDLDQEGHECYLDMEGDFLTDMGKVGYNKVVNAIAEDILVDCVKLEQEVTQIEYILKDDQPKMKLMTRGSDIYYVDVVICTVSVEVLKYMINVNAFAPPLPQEKVTSVNRLCLGQVTKLFFKFSKPLGGEYDYIRFFPSTGDYGKKVYNKISQLLSFDRVNNTDWWLIWMVGELIEDCQNNGPVLFLKELINTIKKEYPEFPDVQIDCDSIIVSDWTTNPFYRGSYSYLKPDSCIDDVTRLRDPVFYGGGESVGILFGGEMTDPQFYSTTHAAYVSGLREAERVASMFLNRTHSEE